MGIKKLRREGPRVKEVEKDDFPKLNIIIKGDVVGSVEAILDVLDTYTEEDKCRLSIVNYGVGSVTETDLELAKVFNGNHSIYLFFLLIQFILYENLKYII